VAALPLVLQEICPLEELLLVELELPHLSIEASRVSQPAQRNKSPLEQKVFLQEEQEQARLGLLANGRKISTNGDAAGSAGVPADWSAAPLESRIGYEKVYLCPFATGEVAYEEAQMWRGVAAVGGRRARIHQLYETSRCYGAPMCADGSNMDAHDLRGFIPT